jgi:hypothetical protein
MKKPPSIMDKDFVYRDSAHTDLKATFLRIRKRQKEEALARERIEAEQNAKVRPFKKD